MEVRAAVVDQVLHVSVTDDGIGGADAVKGSGLVGIHDRVEAVGGHPPNPPGGSDRGGHGSGHVTAVRGICVRGNPNGLRNC